jgi:hypothetical protein
MVIGAVGAVFAILLGGGAFAAYQYLNGGGPQPAEALPSNTLGYVRIDLDPSASQKVNAIRLLRRVPEFEEATGISSDTEDLRKLMFDTMVEGTDCGLSYEEDVEPWIGDRAGFGVVPVDDQVVSVAAIQVSDQQAAEDAVAAIEKCGLGTSAFGSDPIAAQVDVASGGAGTVLSSSTPAAAASEDGDNVAFVGDYMLIAEDAETLPEIVDSAESSPLSDAEQFQSDMDALDGEGFASFWFDVDGLREETASMGDDFEAAQEASEKIHSAFGAIRAGSDHIEFVSQATTDVDISADLDNPIGGLPDSTLMALSASGGAKLVDEYWSNLQGMIENFGGPSAYSQMLADVEQESGLRLPDDLRTILGDNVALAMDSTGLAENLESDDPSDFYFGARLTTDPAAITDVVDRVNIALTAQGLPELITQDSDDGLVVASNEEYAQMLAEGGDLESADGFDTAVPDASESSVAFFLDLDRLADAMAADDSASEDLETVEPMRAMGASLTQVDDGQRLTMRLVFD